MRVFAQFGSDADVWEHAGQICCVEAVEHHNLAVDEPVSLRRAVDVVRSLFTRASEKARVACGEDEPWGVRGAKLGGRRGGQSGEE